MPRAKLDQGKVEDYFSNTEAKRRSTPFDQAYGRHTYRTKVGTHQELKAVAQELGVGLNELVRWMHADFIARYRKDKSVVPVREYVTTTTIIDFD